MNSLTEFAVRRPIGTLMACLIVVILGVQALVSLPVDLLPDVARPVVSVTTEYRGAGPPEIETLVTRPLEQVLGSLGGVERITSTSSEGASSIRLEFSWGKDLDSAVNELRDAIAKIRADLPEDIEEPYIRRFNVADSPVMYLGVASDLDPLVLVRMIDQEIVPALEQVPGVARASARGVVRREIHVDVDRTRLAALDLGVTEIVDALARANVVHPAGDLTAGDVRMLVRGEGEFRSLDEIRGTVVRQRGGAVVRVRDVADVVDGIQEQTEITRVNGRPGVMLYVFKQTGTNTVAVSDAVRAAVAGLNESLRGATVSVRIDTAEYIRQAIRDVRGSAVDGAVLSIVVLVVFLQSFRSTLVVAVSMPLSVLATFVPMYLQGLTLNLVSFGGLALGVGMLVDNSIVVLEAIFLRRAEGLSPVDAAIAGTREVAAAIVASTATTLVVFLPLLFVRGSSSILLRELAWIVAWSQLASLIAGLTLTPALAAHWMERGHAAEAPTARNPLSLLVRGFHACGRLLVHAIESLYRRTLVASLRRPVATTSLLALLLAVSVGLVPRIGTEYLPRADEGMFGIDALMAPGTPVAVMERQILDLERRVVERVGPEMLEHASYIGDTAQQGNDLHRSRVRVKLVPRSQRERGLDEIRKDVAAHVAGIAGVKTRLSTTGSFALSRLSGTRGGSSSDLTVQIRGHDLDQAAKIAARVAEAMRGVAGLVDVDVRKDDRRPELAVAVDRPKAGVLGIAVGDIARTLETTIRGTPATRYREEGDEYDVVVRLRESDRRRVSDLGQIGVASPSDRIVPLKNLVSVRHESIPVTIDRVDRRRVLEVGADVLDRDLGAAVADLQEALRDVPLPEGFSVAIAGDWEEQQKSFRSLRIGFVLAVVLMYMVMAAQFESIRAPLLILLSLPLGGVGVVAALVLTGTTLNIQSFIGIVMLSGIVVNNAIVLVDYHGQLRSERPEADPFDLVVQSGVRRLRPILMTTLTTVLGMLPIAVGLGEGGELQAPLARVVCGGMISGTLITLIAIPLACLVTSRRRPDPPATGDLAILAPAPVPGLPVPPAS